MLVAPVLQIRRAMPQPSLPYQESVGGEGNPSSSTTPAAPNDANVTMVALTPRSTLKPHTKCVGELVTNCVRANTLCFQK